MTEKRLEQRKHHDNLRKERLNEFMKGFGIITSKLKETYQMLTLGGDAELELVDSLDPFSEGIVFRWGSFSRNETPFFLVSSQVCRHCTAYTAVHMMAEASSSKKAKHYGRTDYA